MTDDIPTDFDGLDCKKYEKLVAGLIAGKLKHADNDYKVTHDEKNFEYEFHTKQIDVLVEDSDGTTTLIECKFQKDRIEQDVLASFGFYLDHSEADKGVLVAKNGFQTGAKKIAKGMGVRLLVLESIQGYEKELPIDEISISLQYPEFRHRIVVDNPQTDSWSRLRDIPKVRADQVLIRSSEGTALRKTVREWADEQAREFGPGERDLDGQTVRVDGELRELLLIKSGRNPNSPIESTHWIDLADHVDLRISDALSDGVQYGTFDEARESLSLVEME
ncbi:restriction endonuclease [Halobium salinum]|uniref:Restriction endonuclease n=1 Tax=Halobium salinum TaxID=1364940 RepID=A0ABD5PE99_9EURY|nr:restriction endonuclease [Halobium salinum]